MVKALRQKLVRDLARLVSQAATIALVVACGIASYVAMESAYDSLVFARDTYYADRRFADVVVHLERAPEALALRLEALPGVARVHTRIVETVALPMPDLTEPATARVVSLPPNGDPPLDALHLRKGRTPELGRSDEVVISEPFALAHRLEPGDRIPAVLNGTKRDLVVVGVALSPEFVFAVSGGTFVQDDLRYAILWMERSALAPVFRMEGSFDDVLLSLQPGANERAVLFDVRRVLSAYGVVSVTGRDKQLSNQMLSGELGQLSAFAVVLPAVFLGVAAFLVNVVLARLLHLQRGQIATLKAVGYYRREIALHYIAFASVIVGGGAVLGIVLGDLLGRGMLQLYRPYFRFAVLAHRLDARVVATAVLVSVAAGVLGAVVSVARAARLPPAEAMQPEAPARYSRGLLERLGLFAWIGSSGRMVAREIVRRPLRTLLSCVGVAFGTAVVSGGRFAYDALDLMIAVQFEDAQREDVEVSLKAPASRSVVREMASLPGVLHAEAMRVVPVRVRVDQRYRDTALLGLSPAPRALRGVAQWPRPPAGAGSPLPARGVLIGERFSRVLAVAPGGVVEAELLEGDRRTIRLPVAGTVPDVFGLLLYASTDEVARVTGEEGSVSNVLLSLDPAREDQAIERLKEMPLVLGVTRRREVLRRFFEQAGHMWVSSAILTVFGAVISFGVVYNQARIALSARSRDLATLRVLGFSRREISSMLLGELAVYVAAGLPVGLLLGKAIVIGMMQTIDQENYGLPAFISLRTYAFSALVTVVAATVSALVVRRRLDQLDLVAVLKTRE